MVKVVDIAVLGGRTKSVGVESTDTIAVALQKAGVCSNGYDIFNENGEALTTESVVGDTRQVSLTRQVKGNADNEIIDLWLCNRKLEIVTELEEKVNAVKSDDTYQKLYAEATEKLKKYIIDNDIRNIYIPVFDCLTEETKLKIADLNNEYQEKLDMVVNKANETDILVSELAETTEEIKSVLIARQIIDKNFNIL